ncbi:hypothetical protein LPJ70_007194, partial [Coemansia sp. RSA 2708]
TPQDEPTPEEDYSASTVEVISEATSSAPSDAYSGESSAEADSASSSEEYTAAVPIPSHDTNDTYDASEAENYSQSYQIFDLGSKPDTSGLDGEGPKYPMPNPFPFTPGFIQMHGYSVKEIKAHYALATEFVGDMNADNYQSPYAKGAQSLLGTVADILSDGGCSHTVVRRDITSLSAQEWSRMASVIQRMKNDGWFEYYANIHNREFGNIHGNDNFFPWHRRFLRDFEEVGQRYDSNFA